MRPGGHHRQRERDRGDGQQQRRQERAGPREAGPGPGGFSHVAISLGDGDDDHRRAPAGGHGRRPADKRLIRQQRQRRRTATKDSRTVRRSLSGFGSRRAIDCQVPSVSRPPMTGHRERRRGQQRQDVVGAVPGRPVAVAVEALVAGQKSVERRHEVRVGARAELHRPPRLPWRAGRRRPAGPSPPADASAAKRSQAAVRSQRPRRPLVSTWSSMVRRVGLRAVSTRLLGVARTHLARTPS